jgi:nucleoside phosphorylase
MLNQPELIHQESADVIIITALPVEFKAVIEHLQNTTEVTHPEGNIYEVGKFSSENQDWDVAVIQAGMGNPRTALETERAIAFFKPSHVIFVGVAGGLKDVNLGDVVAATKVYGFEYGKAAQQFKPRPEFGESTYALIQRAQAVSRKANWVKRIQEIQTLNNLPHSFVGPVAAGEKVIASTKSPSYKLLQKNFSDALAVEMEGFGFFRAIHANHQVQALMVRGISDMIDNKSKADASGSQEMASSHAAAFAFEVFAEQKKTGFNDWKHSQNKWLSECFTSEKESCAVFGQVLNIKNNAGFIPRKQADEKLQTWIKYWGKHNSPFVMLGEEGDGKTWATAAWLNDCIVRLKDKCPPVIFVTSKLVFSNEPYTLLSNILKKQLDEPKDGYWEKRFKNWLHREKTSLPFFILVLDGLNENIKFNWRGLLESLDGESWLGRVAIILTCRTEYWKRHFEYLSYPYDHVWALPSFNDEELLQALATKNLTWNDIHPSIRELIAKPRYFDLVVRLKDKMADSGDITVERLIYEDWKDRLERKQQIIHNNDSFLSLISKVSEKFKAKPSEQDEIENSLKNSAELFDEFVSSKILVPQNGIVERFKIDEKYLVMGLGRLLADEVWNAANSGIITIEETIANWLEPQSGMDIKAKICGMAVYLALDKEEFPEPARKALFLYWINHQNLEAETWDRVPAYFTRNLFKCCRRFMVIIKQ